MKTANCAHPHKTCKNPYKWRAENGILCIYNFSWVNEIIDKGVNGGSGG